MNDFFYGELLDVSTGKFRLANGSTITLASYFNCCAHVNEPATVYLGGEYGDTGQWNSHDYTWNPGQVSGTLNSINSNTVDIGGISYDISGYGVLIWDEGSGDFTPNADLIGKDVTGCLDQEGRVGLIVW